ncbi:MAG: transposase [bacterium]
MNTRTDWAHSPSHRFIPDATYIVTAGTYRKDRIFNTPERLSLVQDTLFEQATKFGWELQAWAIMQNHYHFVALAPMKVDSLHSLIQAVHSLTAKAVNRKDQTPHRKIWFQYYDTCITSEKSYLARLHYVHTNPVKHGIIPIAENYQWCSMNWFKLYADSGLYRTVVSFKTDRVSIKDDF